MSDLETFGLIRNDFLRVPGDWPMSRVVRAMLDPARDASPAAPITAIVTDSDGRFAGFLTCVKAIQWLREDGARRKSVLGSDGSGAGSSEANAKQYALSGAEPISSGDCLSQIIEKVVASPALAAPIIEGDDFRGVVFIEDLFERVFEGVLVGDNAGFNPRDES